MLKSVFATSGTFSIPAKDLKAKIKDNGGTVASSLTNSVKYLVTTENEYNKPSTKVKKALEKDVFIVNEDFIDAAIKKGLKKINPDDYSFSKAGKKRKREESDDDEEEEDDDDENEDLESLTVPQLKQKCRELGVKVGGKKSELIKRIRNHSVEEEDEEEEVVKKPPKKKKKITIKKKKKTTSSKETKASNSSEKVERNITFGSNETGLFEDVGFNPPRVTNYKIKKNDPNEPVLGDVCVIRNVVLQVTDFKTNANKYYSIELHADEENSLFRIYTHYGRTGDLENNPDAGMKEAKYFDTLDDAKKQYNKLYKDKTSAKKGYAPIKLASSCIGSEFVQGKSVGKVSTKSGNNSNIVSKDSDLPEKVQELVKYIYSEATTSLTTQVNVRITADGISTPLGVLTLEQVEEGEMILAEIHQYLSNNKKPKESVLQEYSSSFYSKIPHKFGRSGAKARKEFVIRDLDTYKKKMELLQLMKDMLEINSGEDGNVLFEEDIDAKYSALNTEIVALSKDDDEYKKIYNHLIETENYGFTVTDEDMRDDESDKEETNYTVVNIFKVTKKEELERFNKEIGNEHFLYHGSRICNWTGLLSRGILMPENVTKLGIPRTDFGWLGAGIYFGDCSETSLQYCTQGEKGTSFFLLCNVALGKIAKQAKQDGGIRAPPEGFDSIHGDPELDDTEFDDNELCIYSDDQQYMAYLVEWEY